MYTYDAMTEPDRLFFHSPLTFASLSLSPTFTGLGVSSVRLDGSMSLDQRKAIIEKFTTDPTVSVFLMSLKAGGVAINLTAASRCFLMDP